MVEKLSELGVEVFLPLISARSVVVPAGRNKAERWNRLAIESAKQSRRAGVMRIEPITALSAALASASPGIVFSTGTDAPPLREVVNRVATDRLTVFIGPEGGWTDEEAELFRAAALTPASLGRTILRVETAALAAAAVVQALLHRPSS
jgi:16S rRNA (uracil1498-N3)-methyltransferase